MFVRSLAALAALGLIAAAPAASTGSVSFNVGGTALSMPLPAGYCEPKGDLVALAQTVASTDTDNTTHVTLYQCGATLANVGDYVLIKTPVRVLSLTIDRPTLLAQIAPEFDKPLVVDKPKFDAKVADSLNRVSGAPAKVTTQIDTRGHDDVCGYIAGHAQVAVAGASDVVAVGGCVTSVGGRVVEIFRYTKYTGEQDVARMLKEARAMALTVVPAKS